MWVKFFFTWVMNESDWNSIVDIFNKCVVCWLEYGLEVVGICYVIGGALVIDLSYHSVKFNHLVIWNVYLEYKQNYNHASRDIQ